MRIETGEHALDGIAQQFLVFHRFDIVGLDAAEHLGERAQFVDRQRLLGLLRGRALRAHGAFHGDSGADKDAQQQNQRVTHELPVLEELSQLHFLSPLLNE